MFRNEFDVFWKRQEGEYGYSKRQIRPSPLSGEVYKDDNIQQKRIARPLKNDIIETSSPHIKCRLFLTFTHGKFSIPVEILLLKQMLP